jgi:hypothetical protein
MTETQTTWGGPTVPTVAGVDLAACVLCRRRLKHTWAVHVTQVEQASDPLATAAGLDRGAAA